MEINKKGKREGRRVSLDDQALEKVNHFSEELKRYHCKANHSQITSLAVNLFFDRYISKEKSKFEEKFFDRKSYLKNLLSGQSSEDEITNSLKTLLKKFEGGRNAKKKTT